MIPITRPDYGVRDRCGPVTSKKPNGRLVLTGDSVANRPEPGSGPFRMQCAPLKGAISGVFNRFVLSPLLGTEGAPRKFFGTICWAVGDICGAARAFRGDHDSYPARPADPTVLPAAKRPRKSREGCSDCRNAKAVRMMKTEAPWQADHSPAHACPSSPLLGGRPVAKQVLMCGVSYHLLESRHGRWS